jgi:TIR domain
MPCSYHHDFFVSYPNMPEENILTEFVDELVRTIKFLRTGDKLAEPVYVDRERLAPGFRWKTELSQALCRSRALLCVYTEDYFSREYCVREWEVMADLELKRLGRPARSMIIPILLRAPEDHRGGAILPEQLRDLQYEDFRSILAPRQQFATIRVRKQVQRLLKRIDDLRRQSVDPIVDCDSYDALSVPADLLPPPQEAFGGSWASGA